jgi:hypothetical protein
MENDLKKTDGKQENRRNTLDYLDRILKAKMERANKIAQEIKDSKNKE